MTWQFDLVTGVKSCGTWKIYMGYGKLRVGGYCQKGLHPIISAEDIYTKPKSLEQNCRKCRKIRQQANYAAKRVEYNQRSKQWALKNLARRRTQARHSYLRKKFGMSADAYEQMRLSQNGKCLICGTIPTSRIDSKGKERGILHVDHDHISGKIRGLLCHNCNLGLGSFKDNLTLLRQAVVYLENSIREMGV